MITPLSSAYSRSPLVKPGGLIRLCLLFCLTIGLAACTTQTLTPGPDATQLTDVLNGKSLQAKWNAREEQTLDWSLPDEEVMSLNQEMLDFLDAYVPRRGNSTIKLQALLNAVIHKGLLGIDYNPQATHSASNTFFYREGNCLSFSLMFIAMAREVGLKVSFNEVSIPPSWDMLNQQTFAIYKHVNAKVKVRDGHHIVDLNIKDYKSRYRQNKVSDKQAKAQYYNNRAMEFLTDNNTRNAYRYMRKAIQLAPKQAYLWGNFGTIYRREGLFDEAEIAYQHALTLKPQDQVATSNLSRLYYQRGNVELADYYQQQVIKFRLQNPYYRFSLAQQALEKNEISVAREHIEFSLQQIKQEPRFQALAERIDQASIDNLLAQESY
jgi:tetratricopeptide (TPR) repeat protein